MIHNFFAVLMPGTLCVTLLLFKTISVCFCCCECLLVADFPSIFFHRPLVLSLLFCIFIDALERQYFNAFRCNESFAD